MHANHEHPAISPYAPVLLDSLQYQGQSNDCAPYTVATVLNALWRLDLVGDRISRELNRPAWRGPRLVIRRVPGWATFPWGIVDIFRQYGLRASWKPLATTHQLHSALTQRVVLMPIIGGWRPPWAHVMTLVLYDPLAGWGFANTQRNDGRIHWMDDWQFKNQWRATGRLLVKVYPPYEPGQGNQAFA